MTRQVLFWAVAVSVALTAPPGADARDAGASASALGVADSVVTTAGPNAALYFNPAALAQYPEYGIEAGYGYDVKLDGHSINVSLADAKTNSFLAAGLSYTYVNADQAYAGTWHDRSGHQVRGALASGYRGSDFAIFGGVGLHYFRYALAHEDDQEDFTLDAGVLVSAWNLLRVAVVGRGLIKTNSRYAPMLLATGISFCYADFSLAFDTDVDFTTKKDPEALYHVGAEYRVLGMLTLRSGAVFDQITGKKQIGGGLGYISRMFGVDVGLLQNVQKAKDSQVAVTLRFFLP